MKIFTHLLCVSLILLKSLSGQVCCSLVGAVDHGGGTSSTQWNTHWPSHFDDRNAFKWIFGFNTTHTADDELNIRYGTTISTHLQASHYIGQKSIGYVQVEGSWLQLEESLSFAQSSSDVNQLGLRFGFRHLLPGKWGFFFGEFSLPKAPKFSNSDFAFTTGAVPIGTVGWTNRLQTPWFLDYPSILPDVSISFSYAKNQKNKDDVFMDDAVNAHLASSIYVAESFSISPFSTYQSQKLLAPLSPWDTERQTRWLSVINIGIDITPSHHKWNWLHLRFAWPIYRWASNGNFPDGTEPVPRISLTINTGGLIN